MGQPIVLLYAPLSDSSDVDITAIVLLKLPSDWLLYLADWPEELALQFMDAETDLERANAMACAIDSYIDTNGWENENDG